MQIDRLLRTMHRLPDNQRYLIGSHIEDWARDQVNRQMTRYTWERTDSDEDRRKKQDWKTYTPDGTRVNAQFKCRNTGSDIIVSVYQPYYGPDEENVLARDMVGEDIHYYVTYPYGSGLIYVSRSQDIKDLCDRLVNEWHRFGDGRLPFYSRTFADGVATRSIPNPACCQLRMKVEEGDGYRKGERKLLAFLPPHLVPQSVKIKVNPEAVKDYLLETLTQSLPHLVGSP